MRDPVAKTLKLSIACGAAALAIVMLACGRSEQPANRAAIRRPSPAPSAAPQSSGVVSPSEAKLLDRDLKFDHNRSEHKQQECSLCHQRVNNDPVPALPGHSACIDCHGRDYTSESSRLCVVCHSTPLEAEPKPIAFPKNLRQFGLKAFSHAQHLDPAKMPAGTPLPKCDTCHRFNAGFIEASFPRHPECYNCHTHQPGEKLASCQTCHAGQSVSLKFRKGVGPAYSLYRFTHGSHFKQASIDQKCDRCHRLREPAPQVIMTDILQIDTSRGQRHTSTCWTCHAQAREPLCTKCHVQVPSL